MATSPAPTIVSLDEEARSELASLLESQADWEEDARAGSVPDWSEDFADASGDPTIDDPAATADASYNADMESFAMRQEAASGAVSRYRDLAKQIRETPELALTEANVDAIMESLDNKYGALVDADDHPGYLRALPDVVPPSIRAVVQQTAGAQSAAILRNQSGSEHLSSRRPADFLSEGHRATLAAMLQEEAFSLDSGTRSGVPALVGREGERAMGRANSLREIASRLTAGQHTSMSADEMTTVFELANESLLAAYRGGVVRIIQDAQDLRSAVEKQEHALRQAEDAVERSISPEALTPSMPSASSEITEIPVNSRFWPRGFNDVDDSPASLRVLGDPAVLEGDAVVVNMANEPIPPLGLANLGQLAREIAPTDVVVAGDLSSHGDRETVLAAVAAGGRGVLFTGTALTFGGEVNPEVQALVDRGVTVVTLAESEGRPSRPAAVSEALAAYSTVNLIPSVRMDTTSIVQTAYAEALGRPVAVVPTAMPLDTAPRMSPDLDFPDASIVSSGRELVDLVGPPFETKHEQLLAELRERGFTPAVARLDVPQDSKDRLFVLAESSADLREFQAKLRYAGSQMLPPAEYLHLTSMLDDQGKDLSLAQAHAQARAFGLDAVGQVPAPPAPRRGIDPNLLEHCTDFTNRQYNLQERGRLKPEAAAFIDRISEETTTLREFQDEFRKAPEGMFSPVEYRYLMEPLDHHDYVDGDVTKPGPTRPASWEECVAQQNLADAQVRAQDQQRQEIDRARLTRPIVALRQ